MSIDPTDRSTPSDPSTAPQTPAENASAPPAGDASQASPADAAQPATPDAQESAESSPAKRRILIGSQRDPAAYRPKPKHDWAPVDKRKSDRSRKPAAQPETKTPPAVAEPQQPSPPVSKAVAAAQAAFKQQAPAPAAPPPVAAQPVAPPPPAVPPKAPAPAMPAIEELETQELALPGLPIETVEPAKPGAPRQRIAPPSPRDRLTPEMEEELSMAMGGVALDDLMYSSDTISAQGTLEPESRQKGKVLAVQREDVFVELGSREQGVIPVRQFENPPEPGTILDVIVSRFNAEEGLYDLMLPHASVSVADWGDLSEGMVVEARVTGSNTGGLECEVNHIRGFIPVSQIALYRVEDLAQFVGEKFTCLVTEANPERRNLVLSRRAVLEREREEARKTMLESLAPGQLREGVIRKIMDFGAFVDLGSGVDGLLHISQMSWARIKHPSDLFQEGQAIKVRVEKFDTETGRIGLSYRETLENPWTGIESKYPPRTPVHGKVTRIMDFGAFVELEPGVEGLVHISELSRKHVRRVNEVVKEGDEVDVMVLAVDSQAKRISLSMKEMLPPDPDAPKSEAAESAAPPPPPKPKKPTGPLQGGLGRVPGGAKFGLKW